jgi:precorrin-2 dehydrogenase/sirohydrochlorin ferrochelatase
MDVGIITIAMAKYPIFLELRGRRVVVVGGGLVAYRKAEVLVETGARLVVVAKQACSAMARLCRERSIELIKARYSGDYLGAAALVIAATNDQAVNKQVFADCQQLKILCNVVDQPQLCDFFVPAVVRRGDLQIAVGTEGFCPAYASHLRKKLEQIVTPDHGRFLALLEAARKHLAKEVAEPSARKALLGQLVSDASFQIFVEKGTAAWHRTAGKLIRKSVTSASTETGTSKVTDPTGPEDPE